MALTILAKLNPRDFFVRQSGKIQKMGHGVRRRDQLLAALTVPFLLVVAMAAGPALLAATVSLLPSGFVATEIVKFVLGFGVFIGVFAFAFAYVMTGAFGLFA